MNNGNDGHRSGAAALPLQAPFFQSFFSAGFECSTHRRRDGRRLDLISATGHDSVCLGDYQRLLDFGIKTCREGLRWHLIEKKPWKYDFRSVRPMIEASRETGVQIIWDIFHFGWPDDLDIFQVAFVKRLAGLGRAFAEFLRDEGFEDPVIAPVNEPSFVSWGGGEVACLNPFQTGRGLELKAQLTRAALEVTAVVREVLPNARFMAIDPVIHVSHHEDHPEDSEECVSYSNSMFQAWDMLSGRLWPLLGGSPEALDIVGLNFYPRNQWTHRPYRVLHPADPLHRPLRELMAAIYERYGRPLYLSETGTEDADRGPWLKYICREVEAALKMGIPVHGICLYPILNHPGWDNDRHCRNGLWDYLDDEDNRPLEEDLAAVLRKEAPRLEQLYRATLQGQEPFAETSLKG